MPDYTDIVARNSGGSDALVPEPLAQEIIQELPKQSAAMQLMRPVNLSTKPQRGPAPNVLAFAYWVGGDTGLKQTCMQQWKFVALVGEGAAAIFPVPEACL